jgi:hypothetical protein
MEDVASLTLLEGMVIFLALGSPRSLEDTFCLMSIGLLILNSVEKLIKDA